MNLKNFIIILKKMKKFEGTIEYNKSLKILETWRDEIKYTLKLGAFFKKIKLFNFFKL